jgi:hypothetical protein
MPRGRRTHAAGHASTGIPPIPALENSSHFGTLSPKTALCNLKKLDFVQIASDRHTAISNRHLVRLEITATPAKSARSLFLIDTKRPHFTNARSKSPRCRARAVIVSPRISTVYSVRLENAATPTRSTKSVGLLGTPLRVRRASFCARGRGGGGWRAQSRTNEGCRVDAGRIALPLREATATASRGERLGARPSAEGVVREGEFWKGGVEPPHSIERR